MIILDIEASSLDIPESYPIQIAWVNIITNEQTSYYIKPEVEWENWDDYAEELHGISRERLENDGQFVDQVVKRLNQELSGKSLFSDGAYYDNFWLDRLFNSSLHRRSVARLDDIRKLIPEKNLQKFEDEFSCLELPHCALEDAKLLGALCKQWIE